MGNAIRWATENSRANAMAAWYIRLREAPVNRKALPDIQHQREPFTIPAPIARDDANGQTMRPRADRCRGDGETEPAFHVGRRFKKFRDIQTRLPIFGAIKSAIDRDVHAGGAGIFSRSAAQPVTVIFPAPIRRRAERQRDCRSRRYIPGYIRAALRDVSCTRWGRQASERSYRQGRLWPGGRRKLVPSWPAMRITPGHGWRLRQNSLALGQFVAVDNCPMCRR